MKDVKMNIAENLISLRKQNKLTQMELASKLNYSDKAISKWELGESTPGIDTLCELASLYGVSIDYLTTDNSDKITAKPILPQEKANKIGITLLAMSLVFFVSTIIFVYAKIWYDYNAWVAFVWAIPVCTIIAIIFNGIWGKRKFAFFLISLLIWSLLISTYLQSLSYNLWPIFLLGIPPQIACGLWSTLKSRKLKSCDDTVSE